MHFPLYCNQSGAQGRIKAKMLICQLIYTWVFEKKSWQYFHELSSILFAGFLPQGGNKPDLSLLFLSIIKIRKLKYIKNKNLKTQVCIIDNQGKERHIRN